MSLPHRPTRWAALFALVGLACQGPQRPAATESPLHPLAADDPCRPAMTARWSEDLTLVVDVAPTGRTPYFVDARATVSGGALTATFGEAGLPSWWLHPDEDSREVFLVASVACHDERHKLLVRLDTGSIRKPGALVLFTVQDVP